MSDQKANQTEVAFFGGGCFWCTEAIFQNLRGVLSVTAGYSGGTKPNPTYEEVCSGSTGHAEVIKVEFNPSIIKYEDLLEVFFATHDPTTPNRQGQDIGEQYRSIILYITAEQKHIAENFIRRLQQGEVYPKPLVTQIKPLDKFFEAEDSHKSYYRNNPEKAYCQVVINPKLQKFKAKFKALLKDSP